MAMLGHIAPYGLAVVGAMAACGKGIWAQSGIGVNRRGQLCTSKRSPDEATRIPGVSVKYLTRMHFVYPTDDAIEFFISRSELLRSEIERLTGVAPMTSKEASSVEDDKDETGD